MSDKFFIKIKSPNPCCHVDIIADLNHYFSVEMQVKDHMIFGEDFHELRLEIPKLRSNNENSITVLCGIFDKYSSITYLEHKPPHEHRRFQRRFL